MARGVRGKTGKGGLTLATFASGELTAYVRPHRDLHTMKDFDCTRLRSRLGTDVLRFAGASAIGELVVVHAEQEPRPEIFHALELGLDRLEDVPEELVPAACLSGLWQIVAAFGFAPALPSRPRASVGSTSPRAARCAPPAPGMRAAPGWDRSPVVRFGSSRPAI